MADLEELALKKDRGYLVRLVLMLAVGVVVALMLFRGLTGGEVGGCLADTIDGSGSTSEKPPQ